MILVLFLWLIIFMNGLGLNLASYSIVLIAYTIQINLI